MRSATRGFLCGGWIWLAAGLQPAQAEAPASLVDPRPASHVRDGAGLLKHDTVQAIDMLAAELAAGGNGELLVVTVRSADGEDPRRHATAVYNHWQIGHARANRGVLLWVAPSERAAELILGNGIDTTANRSTAANIMQYQIVPAFRAGDPDAGVLAGSRAAAQQLLGLASAEVAPVRVGAAELAPDGGLGQDATATATNAPPAAAPDAESPEAEAGTAGRWTLGLAGAGLAALLAGLAWWQHRASGPRRCRRCRIPLRQLARGDSARHLDERERCEQRLGSADHEVWQCERCGAVDKVRLPLQSATAFAECPHCGALALAIISSEHEPATATRDEVLRTVEHCQHCGCERRSEKRRSSQSVRTGPSLLSSPERITPEPAPPASFHDQPPLFPQKEVAPPAWPPTGPSTDRDRGGSSGGGASGRW